MDAEISKPLALQRQVNLLATLPREAGQASDNTPRRIYPKQSVHLKYWTPENWRTSCRDFEAISLQRQVKVLATPPREAVHEWRCREVG